MVKIGIVGFGNLGKGVLAAAAQNDDMEVVAVFTRRKPEDLQLNGFKAESIDNILKYKGKIDVLILCGGSATDLPVQSPEMLKDFCIIDSFDTHANIPQHFKKLDEVGKEFNNLGLLSAGWDPGLFSLSRLMFESALPDGASYTFWGKGVSQGHSDAIRRIDGVLDAKQYTIPKEEALNLVREGKMPQLSVRDKHLRECFVVVKKNANKGIIEKQIKQMPNYFADYDTIVHFVSEEELKKNHSRLPHGGFVFRTGKSLTGNQAKMEFSLKLDSNPEFTGSVLVAYARAVKKMFEHGKTGAITVFDVPFKFLSKLSYEEQIASLL